MVDKQPASGPSRRNILTAAVLAVVLVLSGVYVLLSLPPHMGSRASAVFGPLEFSLQLEKRFFVRGENISVSISLKNISNQTITMGWAEYGIRIPADWDGYFMSSIFSESGPTRWRAVLNFVASDENGTWIYGFIGRRELSEVSRALAPDETVTQTFLWNQKVDNRWSESPVVVLIPFGTYYIKALSLPTRVEEWPFFEQPETPSMTIRILEG